MDPQLDEPDLRSYLGTIARRKWWVVGITAVLFAASVAMSLLAEPQYKVKARLVSSTSLDLSTLVMGGGNPNLFDVNREAENHIARIGGMTVRSEVRSALPASLPKAAVFDVKVRAVEGADANKTSSVVELSLISSDAEEAAQLLNVYAKTYVAYWGNQQQAAVMASMVVLNQGIQQLDTEIAEIRVQLDDPAITDSQKAVFLKTIEGKSALRSGWDTQLQRLNLGAQFGNFSGAEVVSPAFVPTRPVSPDIPKNLAIGLVFGLFLGVAAAFLRDYFDDSIKTKEILERVTGVPALGLIPKFDTATSELVAAAAPTSAAAESFRSLRTAVKFLSVDREVRVVQITSPSPGEGKTVTAANLAVAFAQAGDRVVLVGADLRRPRAEEILGVSLTPGLTGVLIGEVALPQAIRAVEGLPNLSILPAGYPPPNPSELLSGERARRLVDVLAQTYDLVILDCPPILPVTDALVLARMADTTLLVTSVNRTSRRALDRSVEVLQQVGAPLMGTVMTSLAPGATFGGESYRYDGGESGRYKPAPAPYGGNGYGQTGQYPATTESSASAPHNPGQSSGTGGVTMTSLPVPPRSDSELTVLEPPPHNGGRP